MRYSQARIMYRITYVITVCLLVASVAADVLLVYGKVYDKPQLVTYGGIVLATLLIAAGISANWCRIASWR